MSELDKVFDELAGKRAQQDEERRERHKLASEFLTEFFEQDIKPSQTLKTRGIEVSLIDHKLVLHRPQPGLQVEVLLERVQRLGQPVHSPVCQFSPRRNNS